VSIFTFGGFMGKIGAILALIQVLGPLAKEALPYLKELAKLLKRAPEPTSAPTPARGPMARGARAGIGGTRPEMGVVAGRPERVTRAQMEEAVRCGCEHGVPEEELRSLLSPFVTDSGRSEASGKRDVQASAEKGADELKAR
jgi:hypothetical protein